MKKNNEVKKTTLVIENDRQSFTVEDDKHKSIVVMDAYGLNFYAETIQV